jgi:tight adherence protein B
MTPLVKILLFVCVMLMLASAATLIIYTAREKRERLRQRFASISMRTETLATTVPLMRADPLARQGFLQQLAGVFGIDFARVDLYPVKWWVALVAALLIARVLAFLLAVIFGDYIILLVPLLWVVISRSIFGWWERKRRQKLLDQFPDALSMIVRAVRVGLPVAEAIRIVALKSPEPIGTEFTRVAGEINVGMPMDEALKQMSSRTGVAEYRFFATALALQAQTGGGLSETLDNLGDVIRRRIALRARGFAMASEARTSTLVLSGLPFATALVLFITDSDYIGPLFTDPFGQKLLGVALLLLGCGTLSMRAIIGKTLS